MQIPPARLIDHLSLGSFYALRSADNGTLNPSVSYAEALSRAVRGEIEGVTAPSGRIKYLRVLPEHQRQPAPEIETQEQQEQQDNGRSTAFAVTNLGVYRQAVESARLNEYGITEREIIGYTYAFCAHRRMGL